MKSVKKDYYNKEILNYLIDRDIASTKEISNSIGLSEKSIRNKIFEINVFLKENQLGTIQKKPRVGIWLESNLEQRQRLSAYLMNRTLVGIIDDEKQRVIEVLKILFRLRPWETVTTQKLTEELYLSAPTVLKVLKECENWLQPYQIQVVNERNKGYRLDYRENNYRIAFKDLIMEAKDVDSIKKNMELFFYNIDTKLIQKSIVETENEWNYRFTDESFYEIYIYCCIAYQRKEIQKPHAIGYQEFEILQKYNEYPFAVAIFKRIQDKFHVLFSNEDIQFLSMQIMCSKFIGGSAANDSLEQVKMYDTQLIEFIETIIQQIGNILDVDLSQDEKLKESLVLHLRPTIFRLRHGSPQSNSLINFIKLEYKNVFRAVWSISILFEERYGLQLTEDEVGYLVLYVQSALERLKRKYQFLLIADSSRGHAQLLSQRLRDQIPEIEDMEIMTEHDFLLYGNKEADIIVSSKDLNIKDPRIIVAPNMLTENGMLMLRNKIDAFKTGDSKIHSFSSNCVALFDPELIFVGQQFNDKDSLLAFMANAMESRGCVTSRFLESVMEREKATTTAIGNGISLPHGAQIEVIESKVSVAILDKPILWNDEEVDVVFLLGFKMSTHEEIQRVQTFYKEYISLIEEEENIQRIKSLKNNIELYKLFIQ